MLTEKRCAARTALRVDKLYSSPAYALGTRVLQGPPLIIQRKNSEAGRFKLVKAATLMAGPKGRVTK